MGTGREVAISLDGVRDKNVMQLKKLNTALFPVRYNDKYYADALASGEFTKLGLLLFFPNMFLLIFLKINLMLNLFGQSMSFGFFDTWIFRFCLLLYIIFEEISCFFFPLKMSLSSYYGDLVIFVGFSLASVFDFWALVLYIGKCWSYFDFILTCDNTHD